MEIAEIKSLEPGKVYAVALNNVSPEREKKIISDISQMEKLLGVKFIIFRKADMSFIDAPEGFHVRAEAKPRK